MALLATEIKRIFKMKKNGNDVILDDPNPAFAPDEVLNFYSNAYPELTTSTVAGPEMVDDQAEYSFNTTVGTKG